MQKTHSGIGEDTLWLIDIRSEGGRGSAQSDMSGVFIRKGPSADDRIRLTTGLDPT